jgi:hypothetical protein
LLLSRPLAPLFIALLAVPSAYGQEELSLEEELARLKAEVLRETPTDDPFAEGRIPDLVVLSMTDVSGEVAPCG